MNGVIAMAKRREKGTGNIYQRKDGKWCASLQNGTKPDGKPNRKFFYGKSEAEVRKKLKEYRIQINDNSVAAVQKMPVERYMRNWLETVKKPTLKAASYDRLEQVCENQIFPNIGMLQLHSLKGDDVQGLLNALTETHSRSTIKKVRDALNACLKWAVIRCDLPRNPVEGTVLPTHVAIEKKMISAYNSEQVEAIIVETTRTNDAGKPFYRYGNVVPLLLNTGLRVGEVLALRREDVVIDGLSPYVTVKSSVSRVRNRSTVAKTKHITVEQEPKTLSSIRDVQLNDEAIEAIQNLQKICGNRERVIATKNGNIVSERNIHRMMAQILRRCGITAFHDCIHALRHTFATNALRNGMPIEMLSKILGHANVSTTYNAYIHILKEHNIETYRHLKNLYKVRKNGD